MKPDFIIIGAQKSATSFIQHCLRQHPDIVMPEGETAYFQSPDYELLGGGYLQSLFEGTQQCTGIKRPDYLGRAEVPPRITSDLPHARLVAVLRHPVERAVSAYFHYMRYGTLPLLDVETGMRKILHDPRWHERYPRCKEVLEFGLYAKYLGLYRHFIDNGQLLVLLYDDIKAQPVQSMQRIFRYLGVNDRIVPTDLHIRPQEVVYNLTRLRLLRLQNRALYHHSPDRTRLYANAPALPNKCIKSAFRHLDRQVFRRLLANTKPVLSPSLYTLLHDYYLRDMEQLEILMKIDIKHWKHTGSHTV